MIKTKLHLFKIHRKVIFGNPSIIVQHMFRITPKPFNTVNVIFGSWVDHIFVVLHRVMFAQSFKAVVAPKLVRKVDRALPGFLLDDFHQFRSRDAFHNPRVDSSIALQKAEYNAFTLCPSSTFSFTSAAKVTLVHLNLSRQFATLQFRHMVNRFTQVLVDSRHCLVVHTQIMRQFVGRLDLVEALQNIQLSLQLFQRFLFSTGLFPASNVSSSCSTGFKRTTENALFTPYKVGRAPENVLLPLYHMDILVHDGYDYH